MTPEERDQSVRDQKVDDLRDGMNEVIRATAGLDKTTWIDVDKNVTKEVYDLKPGQIVVIGDLNSDEKGSGARMNADKTAVELIPVRTWRKLFGHQVSRMAGGCQGHLYTLLDIVEALADFQEGKRGGSWLLRAAPSIWFDDAIDVFVYGAKKYKQWNWLKGQAWSVPTASAIRHARAVFNGEIIDQESGLVHTGHFMCNIIMLATFYDTYPEGNDFPDPKFFEETKK